VEPAVTDAVVVEPEHATITPPGFGRREDLADTPATGDAVDGGGQPDGPGHRVDPTHRAAVLVGERQYRPDVGGIGPGPGFADGPPQHHVDVNRRARLHVRHELRVR
jgi:hypothetical protein